MCDGVVTTTKVQKRTKHRYPVIFVILATELAGRLTAGVILFSRHRLSFLCLSVDSWCKWKLRARAFQRYYTRRRAIKTRPRLTAKIAKSVRVRIWSGTGTIKTRPYVPPDLAFPDPRDNDPEGRPSSAPWGWIEMTEHDLVVGRKRFHLLTFFWKEFS